MKTTIEDRAQIFLDALHLYNRELKHENDVINKNAIIKLLKKQDKITRHACAERISKLAYEDAMSKDYAMQIVINTKAT